MAARLALALGSGSARGWAHIGVIRALQAAAVDIPLVCGSSIGALVGAAFASGHLDELEEWVRGLDPLDVLRLMDPAPLGGGFIQGEKVMEAFSARVSRIAIENLERVFACVATDLDSGREVWIRSGPLGEAVRASIALPGLFTPVRHQERWVVDGGLVDPVPVSLCRALGAEHVVAVNLNSGIVGRHRARHTEPSLGQLVGRLHPGLGARLAGLLGADGQRPPGLLQVLATSLNIMQDRITRSRMAGDPPDLVVTPRLAHVGLLEFHRAAECIAEGQAAARRVLPALAGLLE